MRKYFKIFTCGVQDASAYRGNLIVGVLSNFIITAVMFYIWKVIYETNVIIDNYNWEDMKIYLFISFICNSTLSWSAETKISKKNYNRRTYIRLNKTYGIYEYDCL